MQLMFFNDIAPTAPREFAVTKKLQRMQRLQDLQSRAKNYSTCSA